MVKINFIDFGNVKDAPKHAYDPKEIFWIKCGQKQNVYDLIQQAREDTEIYPTLEKYGSIQRMIMDVPTVYAEFDEMMDMRDMFEQRKRAEEIWYNIPIEERQEFGDNMEEFVRNGKKWFESKLAKLQPKEEEPKESEVNNG